MAPRRRAKNNDHNVEDKMDGDPAADQMEQFQTWFRRSRDHFHKWRLEARTCYDFVSGRQWDADDEALLKLQGRPPITFNRVGSVADSVSGLEIANRQDVRFIPRQVGSSGVNELLTEAGRWCRDECYAEDEESDAFTDMVICGVGATESRLSYDEDPDGKFILERVDPLEFYIDGSARARNFTDARHVFRVRQVDTRSAKEMCPGKTLVQIDAVWARDMEGDVASPHDATMAPYYRNDQSPDIDKRDGLVTMVECQWWELTKEYRVVNPMTGAIETISEADYGKLAERAKLLQMPLVSAPCKTKKFYRALLGSEVLKTWDGPKEGGFTWKFMTGKRDRNHGVWYGLVRAMIDPQKWANKWLSQVMYIINSNAKGGLIAEEDAFDNPQQAEETWADPSAITLVTEGGLAKIKQKDPAQFPEGISQLMQFAISSIRDVSGVNVELLGMAATDQPGILEHQRKQAGMTILAQMFDSLRQYRKEAGRLMLYYITNFLSDGRLIRIGGQDDAQYVPLVHQPGLTQYDVIVDDTPSSPNMKEQAWATLTQMMPFLVRLQLPPNVLFEMLKYSPLPSSFIGDVKKAFEQSQKNPPPPDPKMIEAQSRVQVAQINAQADAARAQAEAETEKAKAMGHIAAAHGEAARAAADVQATQAQVFKTTAEGVDALSDAQMKQHGATFDAVSLLLDALQQAHDRQMGVQQQNFDNTLAQQQHDAQLAQMQQPTPQAPQTVQ